MKRIPYLVQCAGAQYLMTLTAARGGPITTVTPAAQSSTSHPAVTAPAGNAAQPTAMAAPATIVSGQKPSSSGPVTLQVTAPQDGAVVNTAQVQVSGSASPGEVVSVNDVVLLVGADGSFSTSVPLVTGANLVEVIASNDSGDSKTVDFTVIYQP